MSNMKLADYLSRIMKQKGLKPRDVKERCGIAESYVRRMLNGKVTNLTVETIGTLAEGLDIDPVELFIAAYGKPLKARTVDLILLAETVQKLILEPELTQGMQDWLRLPEEHRETFLKTFKLVQKQQQKKRK